MVTPDINFIIVTGPNMSGKSTYLKQVALLQIMAQIGCFVPAETATIKICDKLFARVGATTDSETNCSTFMKEMKNCAYIIENLTADSLIFIDELGRGTSIEDGVAVCMAISEKLMSTDAFCFLATHFNEVTKLENLYYNVAKYVFF